MSVALMLAVQAAAPSAAPAETPKFDLRDPASVDLKLSMRECDHPDPNAIVVCGRGEGQRIKPLHDVYGPSRPLVAETSLGGNKTLDLHVQGKELQQGMVSNRLLVGFKLAF